MNDVIDIDEYQPHTVSEVICVKCGKRWISARPDTVRLKDMECYGCGLAGYVIETGEMIMEEE